MARRLLGASFVLRLLLGCTLLGRPQVRRRLLGNTERPGPARPFLGSRARARAWARRPPLGSRSVYEKPTQDRCSVGSVARLVPGAGAGLVRHPDRKAAGSTCVRGASAART